MFVPVIRYESNFSLMIKFVYNAWKDCVNREILEFNFSSSVL